MLLGFLVMLHLTFWHASFFALMLLLLVGMLSLNVARFERRCGMPCVTFLVAKLCQFFDCSSDVFDMLVNMAFG